MATESYRLFGRTLLSNVPLPELAPAPVDPATFEDDSEVLRVEVRDHLPFDLAQVQYFAWPREETDPDDAQYARVGEDLLISHDDDCHFLVQPRQRKVVACSGASTSAGTLRHLLLDQALPRLMGHLGHLVLHGGAVTCPQGTVLIIGRSGLGKSTLTGYLARDGQLLGDDCVMLWLSQGEALVQASYPGLRLYPDSLGALYGNGERGSRYLADSDKRRLDLDPSPAPEPAPVSAVLVLNDPEQAPADGISITPLGGSEAVMSLLRRSFLLDPHDAAVTRALWQSTADLVRSGLRVASLAYPRELHQLHEVATSVRAYLAPTEE